MITQLVDSARPFSGPDSQQTTFALDAMSRFVCNTLDEVVEAQALGGFGFDVVVIGSGMYGAFTAAKIFEFAGRSSLQRRPRILVLESGPFLISEHFQNLPRVGGFFDLVNRPVVDENQSYLSQIGRQPGEPLQGMVPHHRCVGGKSLFWGGWSPPLTTGDDLSHWPPEVRDYLTSDGGYRRIAAQIGTDSTEDFVRGALLDRLHGGAQRLIAQGVVPALTEVRPAPIAVQGEGPISGLFSIDKFSSLPLLFNSIREDAENSGNFNGNRHLFLVPNTEVLRIETKEASATTLVLAARGPSSDPNRPGLVSRVVRFALPSTALVCLAGNTINSTRLALNSFRKPPQLGHELAGKNLMVHVRGNYQWRIRKSALPPLPPAPVPAAEKELAQCALHVEGRVSVGSPPGQIGRFHFQFYAVKTGNDDTNAEKFLYRVIPNIEDLDEVRAAIAATDMDDWIVVGIRTCGETFGDPTADPDQRLSSSISVNPFGGTGDDVYFDTNGAEIRVPKAFVTIIERGVDAEVRQAQTDAAFDFIAALIGAPASAARDRNGDDLQFIGGREDGVGTTYHESGTLWLGDDPATSVTDVHGRLHHMSNVLCVDQSLFPTVGSANPVPTGLALSQRAARHIVSRLTSAPVISTVEDGFESLFDGTLDRWEKFGDGVIQPLPGLGIIECGSAGTDSVLGFIRTTGTFTNFTLRLDWKAFDIRANSGVFLRMPAVGPGGLDEVYRSSIEIQIDETGKDFDPNRVPQSVYGSSLHKTGAVYGRAPATRWAAKAPSPRNADGYWNAFEIEVIDDLVSVTLNGEPVVVRAQVPPQLVGAGHIGLQCHTDIVQFRNIRIREISGG
ncbi:family 16 glycoside hydrolase [Mycolicibacterium cosmeticum]|uniref:family 16 glycoside hydrolase n=1 Tax=Mycolicibacterium cosmeticum TaxID=258533 RepID=UPI003204AE73